MVKQTKVFYPKISWRQPLQGEQLYCNIIHGAQVKISARDVHKKNLKSFILTREFYRGTDYRNIVLKVCIMS